jgi:hypothetical protein
VRVPSIKGSVFSSVVEDVERLIREGRVSREKLEAKLGEEALAHLDESIQPSLWYPIESYRVLSELLVEIEGRGRIEYMFERGERSAQRLFNEGLYEQLRYASEKAESDTRAQSQKAGRLIVTLAPAMFNFTRWSFHADPETPKRFTIQVDDARDFPEVLRYSAAGFCHAVAETACKAKLSILHERVQPDRILIIQAFADV